MNDSRRFPSLSDGPHRCKELDGLRGLAVLGVMYTHFFNDNSMLGTLGVSLFFVLSGYLITGILIRSRGLIEERANSTLPRVFKTFYVRRMLRIFPVYYSFLFILWVAGVQLMRDQFWWHATFNSNLLFVLRPFTELTAHLWTLAVEEQFYLFWPAVILLAPKKYLLPILLALIASAPIYRFVGIVLGFSENGSNIVTIACLDSLGVGALLAYVGHDERKRDILLTLGFWSLPVLPLVAIFGRFPNAHLDSLERTLCALAFVWIIARTVSGSKVRAFGFLRSRLIVGIGVVSYGAYVFHLAAADLVKVMYFYAFGQQIGRGTQLFMLAVTMTLVIATVSWKFLEQPINSLKAYWPNGAEKKISLKEAI